MGLNRKEVHGVWAHKINGNIKKLRGANV